MCAGHSDLLGGVLVIQPDNVELRNRILTQRSVLGSVPVRCFGFISTRTWRVGFHHASTAVAAQLESILPPPHPTISFAIERLKLTNQRYPRV